MRRLLPVAALLVMSGGALACTVDVASPNIEFGEHEIGSSPASTEMTVSVSVTCPQGVSYRLYPYSSSTNSAIYLAMTNNGSANGNNYMMMKRLDGTLMKNNDTATHISGTGNDAPQEYQVKVFLAGSTTPTTSVAKLGDFDQSNKVFRVKRLDNNGTVDSLAQQITGRVTGACTIASGGNLEFGTIVSPANASVFETQTSLSIQCTNSVVYKLYADRPTGSSNNWVNDSIRPVAGKESDILMYFSVRPAGTSDAFQKITNTLYRNFTGTGSQQNYDLKAELSVNAKAIGQFSFTLSPTITF